jgi:hypothetical protein
LEEIYISHYTARSSGTIIALKSKTKIRVMAPSSYGGGYGGVGIWKRSDGTQQADFTWFIYGPAYDGFSDEVEVDLEPGVEYFFGMFYQP